MTAGEPARALTEERYLDDPRPLYHWLREHHPVCPLGTGKVALTRYADAHRVVRDSRFRRPAFTEIVAANPEVERRPSLSMFFRSQAYVNPPELARVRRFVTRELTTRRMDALSGTVDRMADGLLDDIASRLAAGATVDMHAEFALGIARNVLADLLGVPDADRDRLTGLVNRVLAAIDPLSTSEQLDAADEASHEVDEYFTALAAQRRADPRDDLVTALASPREGADRLTDDELPTMLWGTWLAGFETTASGIDHGLLVLARNPRCGPWLDGDPDRAEAFVEETLRYEPQVLLTSVSWLAGEDVTVGETLVRAGTDVRLMIGAINHDPATFADPDRFDPARPATPSFAFSQGPHYCVGQALARMEMSVALRAVRRRLPGLALAGQPRRVPTMSLRRFGSLPMELAG